MHTPEPAAQRGAAVYSPLVLALYDWWVLGFSNRYAWACPTGKVLLPFFRQHLSARHLDVGVGTGYYLAHSRFHPDQQLSLLDLNPNSLAAAAARVAAPDARARVAAASFDATSMFYPMSYPSDAAAALPVPTLRLIHADVLDPGTRLDAAGFDSISLFYLLHCLPGNMAGKAGAVFDLLRAALAPGGVVYGATILGAQAEHNRLGRRLLRLYNAKGIFGNDDDHIEALQSVLARRFIDISISQQGRVALFSARAPI